MNKSKIILLIILISFVSSPRLSAQDHGLATEYLFNLGEAYFKQNRYIEAKSELKRCLLLDPQHQQARELLQRLQGKPVESMEDKSRTEARVKDELREKAILLALEKGEKILKETEEKQVALLPPEKKEAPGVPSERIAWGLKQGTWQLKQGEFYTELYTKYYWHTQQFDSNGNKKRWDYGGGYYEILTEYKLEYGFTDKISFLLYPIFKRTHWKDDFKDCRRAGFVEIWPGVKYLLFDEPFLCWLQARVKFPLNYREGAGAAAVLGTHQIDGEVKLLTAQPWPKLPGYTKFELGFRARNEEPTNEITYLSQLGYNLTKNMLIELGLEGQEGLYQTGGTDEDWIKFTIGPIFKVGPLNVKLGYGNTFAGENTSAAEEIYLSFYTWW